MKALVYHGDGVKRWERMPDPALENDTDAIIEVSRTSICGTDLHILEGQMAEIVKPGTILGHEATGTVVEAGKASKLRPGDRVIAKCVASCGVCKYCRSGMFGQCVHPEGGWVLGGKDHGVQAEYARVPFADSSLIPIPEQLTDEQVVYLSDIMITAFEVGVLRGGLEPGQTVVVIGAGPVGLSVMQVAQLYSPAKVIAVELSEARRRLASRFADVVVTPDDARAAVDEVTEGRGADVAIEAVGVASTFEQCCDLVRAGGRVANIGAHGHPVTLHLESLWIKDVTITMGIPNHTTAPVLLSAIESGRIDPTLFTTHNFELGEIIEAYDVFADPASTDAVKVLMAPA